MKELKQAYICVTLGIISFVIPLSFFIMFYAIWDKGTVDGFIMGGLFLYFGIVAVGIVALVLGILSVFFGITALLKIKNEPGKYSGKGKAIVGIALPFIFPIILFIRIMYIHFHL
jgi:hypothetical protein